MPGGGRPRENERGGGDHGWKEASVQGGESIGKERPRKENTDEQESGGRGDAARRKAVGRGGDGGPGGQWTHTAGLLEKPEIRFPAAQQEGLLQTIPTDADLGNLESNTSTTTCMPLTC